jgi:predicted RNA-binding protein YlqC (UPF0109 family)
VIKGIFKFLGLSDDTDSKPAKTFDAPGDGSIRDLESFVDYIVRALVDEPEAVSVSSEEQSGSSVIKINCKKEDIGKIVGKKGKTIMAIRSLVSGAAGRMQKRVAVEVVD